MSQMLAKACSTLYLLIIFQVKQQKIYRPVAWNQMLALSGTRYWKISSMRFYWIIGSFIVDRMCNAFGKQTPAMLSLFIRISKPTQSKQVLAMKENNDGFEEESRIAILEKIQTNELAGKSFEFVLGSSALQSFNFIGVLGGCTNIREESLSSDGSIAQDGHADEEICSSCGFFAYSQICECGWKSHLHYPHINICQKLPFLSQK